RLAFCHDNDVDGRYCRLMAPERFAGLPLDAVALDGRGRHLARHRQPQSRRDQPVRCGQQGKKGIGRTNAVAEDARERFRFQQTPGAGKPEALISRLSRRDYGQSRARPLARRAASTLRPPLVAMRARKPWVRLRRRLLGWNVLFMTAGPLLLLSGCKKTSRAGARRKGGKIKRQVFVCQQK